MRLGRQLGGLPRPQQYLCALDVSTKCCVVYGEAVVDLLHQDVGVVFDEKEHRFGVTVSAGEMQRRYLPRIVLVFGVCCLVFGYWCLVFGVCRWARHCPFAVMMRVRHASDAFGQLSYM